MKLFFDHRNFTGLYITIFADGDTMGYSFLQKNKITAISIPNSVKEIKICCSFRKVGGCKKLGKEVVEIDGFPQRKGKLSLKNYKRIDDKWKFPYYFIVNIEGCEEDMCFFPMAFSEDGVQGALYYQVVLYSGEEYKKVSLRKDHVLEKEIARFRYRNILKNLFGSLVSLILVFVSARQILLYDLPSYEVRGVLGFLILGVVFAPICIGNIWGNYKYQGMINYKQISDKES